MHDRGDLFLSLVRLERTLGNVTLAGPVLPHFNFCRQRQSLRTMSDTDEYAAFTLSEFTEEDFSQIDAAVALGNPSVPRPGGGDPSIAIELEDFSTRTASAADIGKVRNEGLSPFQRYRPGKVLSVTDLVSPAWYIFIQSSRLPIGAESLLHKGVNFSSITAFVKSGQDP